MAIKIYTAGKMSGVPLEHCMQWGFNLEDEVNKKVDYAGGVQPIWIHPPLYYNYEHKNHKNEREVKLFELRHVKDCDILIVDLNGINDSVGSHFEIAAAESTNKYIIGIGSIDGVHPWITDALYRVESDVDSAAEYIVNYLL